MKSYNKYRNPIKWYCRNSKS